MTIRRRLLLASVLALNPTLTLGSPAPGIHVYDVSVDDALDTLSVHACFDGTPPTRLVSGAGSASRLLQGVTAGRGEQRVSLGVGRRGIRVGEHAAGTCIDYSVELGAIPRRDRRRFVIRDTVAPPSQWLWRPFTLRDGEDIEVRFALPEGVAVSAPWRELRTGVYRLGATPLHWPSTVVFGRFETRRIEVPGASLRVALLNGEPAADWNAVETWLGEAAAAVATLYGRFPIPEPQIIVYPVADGGEPVPWANVVRGGGPAAQFYIDQREPLDEFRADWTATHELSHMLLPYLRQDYMWLSEGFASYYQNVLRARAGMLSEAEAWRKLVAGFERGRDGTRGMPLREASRSMHRTRGYMRVYWSGAAVALLADLELRRRSNGRMSLDTALERLQACCLPADRLWEGRTLMARLDELTGTQVFSELDAAHAGSARFPDTSDALTELGVVTGGRGVRLLPDAPAAAYRRAIMRRSGSGSDARTSARSHQNAEGLAAFHASRQAGGHGLPSNAPGSR